MSIGYIRLKFYLPGCLSLKEKRRRLKPMLERIRREFNIAAAEIDHQDVWQTAEIGLVTLSNDPRHAERCLQTAVNWIEERFPELIIEEEALELIS